MRFWEIENVLANLEGFQNPKLELEQYQTTSHLATMVIKTAHETFDDIEGKLIIDLGAGCGVLAVTCALAKSLFVIGIDIDIDALEIAKINTEDYCIDLVLGDALKAPYFLRSNFPDTVVMNPPFGTKQNDGIDISFIKSSLLLCKHLNVYSFHKSSTRSYIERTIDGSKAIALMKFSLPKSYKFHKKESVDIEVDLVRTTKNTT